MATSPSTVPARPRRSWLSRNVLVLGLVSLLTDAASEMVVPLLPVFVTGVLGAGAAALGWIEGVANAVAALLRLFSGVWSDRLGRYRPFVICGYGLASVVRPLLALSTAVGHVLTIRAVDRVGKGLRGSPRDALIAGSVEAAERGRAFGLHRAMDHVGAFLGPLLALGVLTWWTTDLRTVFWLTAIPGALVIVVALLGVREVSAVAPVPAQRAESDAPVEGGRLVLFLVPLGLFTLANASEVFLLLKAGASRSPLVSLPLLWMGLNIVKAVSSLPGGWLADRWGARRAISLGWLVFVATFVGLAFSTTRELVWALFLAYGLHHGLSEAAEKALVSRLAGARRWGTAFGWYHLTVGLLTLPASVLFGVLWDAASPRVAFLTSAAIGLAALLCLWVLSPRDRGAARG